MTHDRSFVEAVRAAELLAALRDFNHELNMRQLRNRAARRRRDDALTIADATLTRCRRCDALIAPRGFMRVRHRCTRTRTKEAADGS